MSKFKLGMKVCGVLLLWAATAVALPAQTFTSLLSFDGRDGGNPNAGLVQGTDGNFYGTASGGGAPNYEGTVFKMTPGGKLTTLHSFDFTDGTTPVGGLVQGTDGNFYGTTEYGGDNGSNVGTVFTITPSGTLNTLYDVCPIGGCADGANPHGGLIQSTDGTFYGTTQNGGVNNGGTVFNITSSGALTTIYSFCSESKCADGYQPFAGLVQATDGSFYGTTLEGGTGIGKVGTIFEMTPNGALTTLHSFCMQKNGSCEDGSFPSAGLLQDTNGTFYGTTSAGGANGVGMVFSLSLGLVPFVKTLPTSGAVGSAVKILGTSLTGATSVTFNGTSTTFTVNSTGTAISTTVPTGATTGTVQIVTPSGTLSSNVLFTVN
jgi:uncharacterized repeat protein (TIGR03803 family)